MSLNDLCYSYQNELRKIIDEKYHNYFNTYIAEFNYDTFTVYNANESICFNCDILKIEPLKDLILKKYTHNNLQVVFSELVKNLMNWKTKIGNLFVVEIYHEEEDEEDDDSDSFQLTFIDIDAKFYEVNSWLFFSRNMINIDNHIVNIFSIEEHNTYFENILFYTHCYYTALKSDASKNAIFRTLKPLFFIDEGYINLISTRTYEGKVCSGKIAFVNEKEIDVNFLTNFYYDDMVSLRKLLELTKKEQYLAIPWTVVPGKKINEYIRLYCNENKIEIKGLINDLNIKNCYSLHIHGYMDWEIKFDDTQVLKFKDGKVCINFVTKNQEISKIAEYFKLNKNEEKNLEILIKNVSEQLDGAMIIISDIAKQESERLADKKRGILVKSFSLCKDWEILKNITSIDGAIFIDKNLECHGIGMIVDGKAIAIGDPKRGSRYNSAKNYIANIKGIKSIAIVVSKDGYIDCFYADL